MVAESEVSVMEGPLGRSVEPAIRYADWEFGVRVREPMVRSGGVVPVGEGRGEVLGP